LLLSVYIKIYYVIENALNMYKINRVCSNFMFAYVRVDE